MPRIMLITTVPVVVLCDIKHAIVQNFAEVNLYRPRICESALPEFRYLSCSILRAS